MVHVNKMILQTFDKSEPILMLIDIRQAGTGCICSCAAVLNVNK